MPASNIQLPAKGWRPKWFQLGLWKFLEGGGKRACVVWPRRHGKDYVGINWTAVASQVRTGLYWMVYPFMNQGRRIAWNGMDEAGNKFLDAFPEELRATKNNAEMRLELKNGSVFQIMGADDPNRLVGSNPVGVVFSEWSLMDPLAWKLISPILAQNGGWAVFIYTPRGKNHGLSMLNHAKAHEGWYHEHRTSKDLKFISIEALRNLRDDLKDEALFQQEAFCSFDIPMQGSFYAVELKRAARDRRVCETPHDRHLQVHTAWDLGYNDSTAVWFFQQHGGQVRLIDYLENAEEGLEFYVRELRARREYNYGRHYFPWDVNVHDLGEGKTRREALRNLGLKATVVPKHKVEDGIEACRGLLSRCWIDPTKCERGLDALRSYRKEWDEKNDCFKKKPVHDWACHAADAFRTLAMGTRAPKEGPRPDRMAEVEYDIFA